MKYIANIIINKHFHLLTEIYRQPTKIENFNRQPTSGPPINSVLAQQLSGNLRSNNSNNLKHYYYYFFHEGNVLNDCIFWQINKLKMKLKLKTKQKATISINSMIFTVVVHYQILTVFSAIFSSPIISTSTLFIKNGFYNRLAHKIAVAKGDGPVKRKNK